MMTLSEATRAAMQAWCAHPIRYGVDDCCLAIADIYVAALGIDPAAPWRGRYRTKRGARRLLGGEGIVGTLDAVAREHGWRRIRPRQAADGDLGIIRTPEGPACAIRYGGRWLGRIDYGFSALDRAALAWSVS